MREVLPEAGIKQFRIPVVPAGVWILLAALLGQVALFSVIAQNFLSASNFVEVLRFSVELGVLAVALTPVIITGGIDLSIGSMMGLAAVVFGATCRNWNLPVPAAACMALLSGIAGGGLNAFLISKLQLPPLIVTLGSFWMVPGLAGRHTHAR